MSQNTDAGNFNLFAFTDKAFDPTKPSLLLIEGGPGGLWGANQSVAVAQLFPNANIIFSHYRGAGCSAFNNSDAALDKFITSKETVADFEAIRKVYGIKTWKAVVGWSYGTNIARRYAHSFPKRVQALVLEGLGSSASLPEGETTIKMLKNVHDRYQVSLALQSRVSESDFSNFETALKNYFVQINPGQNFGFAAAWEFYEKFYADYYAKAGTQMPKYLNRGTFLAVTELLYSGVSESSDVAILRLLSNFNFIQLDPATETAVAATLQVRDQYMFPFLYSDYLTTIKTLMVLSWRVNLTMVENDKAEGNNVFCSPVDTIVLNGTQDLATPVENVQNFLSNKACASGSNKALLVQGGGHSSIGEMKCLVQYVNHALDKLDTSNDLKSCELPVSVKAY